jgi:hypothetical protein
LDPWRAFYEAWVTKNGGAPTTATDLGPLAGEHLGDILSDERQRFEVLDQAGKSYRLGRALATMLDRPIQVGNGTRRLQKAKLRDGNRRWMLEAVGRA